MPSSNKKPKPDDWKSPEYLKNEIRFKLLVNLTSFQEDIKKIRKELKIPLGGFNDEEGFQSWDERVLTAESDRVILSKSFREQSIKVGALEAKDYGEFLKQKWLLHDKIPINRLNNRLEQLCSTYKLPANFGERNFRLSRLFGYITMNEIVPPSNNWVIQPDPDGRRGTTKWLSIKTYAPLSNKEFTEAKEMLISLQNHYFPKTITLTQRAKDNFDRDLEIYKTLVLERSKKPVRKKSYSGYLALLSPTERKKWEHLHPKGVRVEFDEETTREVARKMGISHDTAKGALKRMRKRIVEFFGEEYLGH